jgi:hypothetical protein
VQEMGIVIEQNEDGISIEQETQRYNRYRTCLKPYTVQNVIVGEDEEEKSLRVGIVVCASAPVDDKMIGGANVYVYCNEDELENFKDDVENVYVTSKHENRTAIRASALIDADLDIVYLVNEDYDAGELEDFMETNRPSNDTWWATTKIEDESKFIVMVDKRRVPESVLQQILDIANQYSVYTVRDRLYHDILSA